MPWQLSLNMPLQSARVQMSAKEYEEGNAKYRQGVGSKVGNILQMNFMDDLFCE